MTGLLRKASVEAYLSALQRQNYSPRSLSAYGRELALLDAAFPNTPDAELSSSVLRRSLAEMSQQGLAPRTIRRRLSVWRGYLDWCLLQSSSAQAGQASANPLRGLKAPRLGQRLPKALSVEKTQALLDQPHAQDWRACRDQALLELAYASGLRLSELVGLCIRPQSERGQAQLGHIDLETSEVIVVGKGGKRRSVPMGRMAVQAIQAWLPHRSALLQARQRSDVDQPALFLNAQCGRLSGRSVERRFAQRAQAASLGQGLHPHMLRHSFASHLLQSSGDLRAVQELLGHAQIATTQVYTALDFQRLASVYDSAHPRARRRTSEEDPKT